MITQEQLKQYQDDGYLVVRALFSQAEVAFFVDDCDEANGCLRVVPGSHTWPLLCSTQADTSQSFTDVTVPLPVPMKSGDMLFFNGQIVHGSLPNTTENRFRRALIGHYIVGAAEKVYRSRTSARCL